MEPRLRLRRFRLERGFGTARSAGQRLTTELLGLLTATGDPLAQWVKRWSAKPEARAQFRLEAKMFSTVKSVPLHTTLYYHAPIVLI